MKTSRARARARARARRATSGHQIQLPLEIVEDILSRFPVKSLKRFAAMSKSWCSLIRSPEFITSHLSFSSKNKVSPLLRHGDERMVSLLSDQNPTTGLDVVANFRIPYFHGDCPMLVKMIGCCNGILCLWNCCNIILLWNPATRESKRLTLYLSDAEDDAICFGYDPKRNDYNVVRIDVWESSSIDESRLDGVAIYSLSTNSWRNLDITSLKGDILFGDNGSSPLSINGVCHFWCKVDDKESVLSIDLSKEALTITPLPFGNKSQAYPRYHYRSYHYHTSWFYDIDGSLGGIQCHDFSAVDKLFDVWVLGELGVKNSWTKLFTIGPISGFQGPILRPSCNNNGAFFFVKHALPRQEECFHVRYQHPSKQEITIPQIREPYLDLAMYAESLVSLRKYNKK